MDWIVLIFRGLILIVGLVVCWNGLGIWDLVLVLSCMLALVCCLLAWALFFRGLILAWSWGVKYYVV